MFSAQGYSTPPVEAEIDWLLSRNMRRQAKGVLWVLAPAFAVSLLIALIISIGRVALMFHSDDFQRVFKVNNLCSVADITFRLLGLLVVFEAAEWLISRTLSYVLYKVIASPQEACRLMMLKDLYSRSLHRKLVTIAFVALAVLAVDALTAMNLGFATGRNIRHLLFSVVALCLSTIWYEKLKSARFCDSGFQYAMKLELGFVNTLDSLSEIATIGILFWVFVIALLPWQAKIVLDHQTARMKVFEEKLEELSDPVVRRAHLDEYWRSIAREREILEFLVSGKRSPWDTFGVVLAERLDVRERPGLASPVAFEVTANTPVHFLVQTRSSTEASGRKWLLVKDMDGRVGWVAGECLRVGHFRKPYDAEWITRYENADRVASNVMRALVGMLFMMGFSMALIPVVIRKLGASVVWAFAASVVATVVTESLGLLLHRSFGNEGLTWWANVLALSVAGFFVTAVLLRGDPVDS